VPWDNWQDFINESMPAPFWRPCQSLCAEQFMEKLESSWKISAQTGAPLPFWKHNSIIAWSKLAIEDFDRPREINNLTPVPFPIILLGIQGGG
jgi:hypothetical protein